MDTTRIKPHSAIGVYVNRLKKIEAYLLEKFDFSIDEAIASDKVPQRMGTQRAAEYLGCHRTGIYKYRKDGVLPFHLDEKGRVYFLKSEIDTVFTKKPNQL